MNNRIKAVAFCIALILALLPSTSLLHLNVSALDNLGSVTECRIAGERIIVSGSIKHSVLVSNRESTIAVYKLLPWENTDQIIAAVDPIARTNMSISFDFELPCQSIADKTSLYAVAIIDKDGTPTCISAPQYPDAVTADTSGIGFKGVKTDNTAAALASHPGSAIVDVYLDKLDNGNKSGHIYYADGDIYYFDRELIKDLDKQIISYTAMGCEVLLRFLISPGTTNLPFCTDSRIWATNKCVVVDDTSALNAIYGYTYFLMSRYNGGEYGSVSGIILGRGADMPILYNYASLVSEDYETVYARSLVLIALAATAAAGDGNVSMIVPVGDTLTEKGGIYAERFVSTVADYIQTHSQIMFTLMCESTHNPYHINDSMFNVIAPSDETGEDGEADVYPETETVTNPSVTEQTGEEVTFAVTDPAETDAVTAAPDETVYSGDESTCTEDTFQEIEVLEPYVNTVADGFYCTDSINIFINAFSKLKKKYTSLNKGFAWCWYPDANTLEGSLGICYSYNYMKLAAEDADFFAVAFEGEAYERFSGISHLFKYIDTVVNIKETEYAREIFDVADWSEIIKGYDRSTGVCNVLIESELQADIADFTGTLVYMDYTANNNVSGWYEGIYCNSVSHHSEKGIGALRADFDFDNSALNQAEIGYIFKNAEPLLLADALTFDVVCGENDSSLYEIAVYINCGENTIVSKSVIEGGIRTSLSADVKDLNNESAVKSLRISITRITGSGACSLKLYSVGINSMSVNDESLSRDFQSIRDNMRSEPEAEDTERRQKIIITVILLTCVALFSTLFALANDRRLLKNTNTDDRNHLNQKGTRYERH